MQRRRVACKLLPSPYGWFSAPLVVPALAVGRCDRIVAVMPVASADRCLPLRARGRARAGWLNAAGCDGRQRVWTGCPTFYPAHAALPLRGIFLYLPYLC